MDSEFIDGHEQIGGHDIPMIAGGNLEDNAEEVMANLAEAIKDDDVLDPKRPYRGQQPLRAAQGVSGLTMRDVADCLIRAMLLCLSDDKMYERVNEGICTHDDLYHAEGWDDIDPGSVLQNLGCEIEKHMGIYPNLLDGSVIIDSRKNHAKRRGEPRKRCTACGKLKSLRGRSEPPGAQDLCDHECAGYMQYPLADTLFPYEEEVE